MHARCFIISLNIIQRASCAFVVLIILMLFMLYTYIVTICFIVFCQRLWFYSRLGETSITPPLFIEVPVPSKESERPYICVLGVSILPISTILIFDFGNVPTDNVVIFFFILILDLVWLPDICYACSLFYHFT